MENSELQQWLEHTSVLIDELLEDGSNPEAVHTIEHHFASEDFTTLENAAVAAFKLGFEVQEPEQAELEGGGTIFCFDIITEQYLEEDVLLEETRSMFALAQKHNLDYDGWGTYFEE
ncbi:ribonuclease E inhibitor RraB [Thalassotalea mangrovi]|uniref:Regulator of ribonuclease activity B n=1 Tax=Thalassotalea mangrovi TaxID=2572245 RepID=A0A4U1B897_9GAMM|nr:ribonuclease E inhibitor RraB [Thalassotalea mangrovi]TKB46892.1 ribonuclease E inhibitor RraB [Thalassotalea mangrovi]